MQCKNGKHVVLYGLFITIMRFFHVEDIDCVTDLIKINRWQN